MFSVLPLSTTAHQLTAWESFLAIISKPDNMPVAGALLAVILFSVVAFRQALKNDRLISEGRKDEILSEMQKP